MQFSMTPMSHSHSWPAWPAWPAQLPELNIIEPFWSVLETTVRNRFPPPASRKQLEDVIQEEWYKILLWTVQK
jgi:hypothetical protein